MFKRTRLSSVQRLLLMIAFGGLFLFPAYLSVFVLETMGIPVRVSAYLVALCFPALLLPLVPFSQRKAILSSGWPAKVAFAGPGIALGVILLMAVVFHIGYFPFVVLAGAGMFAASLVMMAIFLLLPDP